MTDALIAQAIAKMKRYGLVLGGDGHAFGLGSMTDARWKTFFDTMAAEGLYPKGLDYKKAYDLALRAQHLAEFSMIALLRCRQSRKTLPRMAREALRDLDLSHVRGGRVRLAAGAQRLRQVHGAAADRRAARAGRRHGRIVRAAGPRSALCSRNRR